MSPPDSQHPSARQIVERAISRHRATQAGKDTAAHAAAAACDEIYRELSRWVGPHGSEALFRRALAQARSEHPALEEIRVGGGSDPHLEGVAASGDKHGDAATGEAIEAMLFALIELLARLIGYDMVTRLVAGGQPWSEREVRSPIGTAEVAR
jgi:4-aminobutyrate aminotransferase-like enzyme